MKGAHCVLIKFNAPELQAELHSCTRSNPLIPAMRIVEPATGRGHEMHLLEVHVHLEIEFPQKSVLGGAHILEPYFGYGHLC